MQSILDEFTKAVDQRTSLFDVKIDSETNETLTLMSQGGPPMSTIDNKVLFHRFVEEVMNQGNLPTIDELFAPNFVGHIQLPPAPTMNREGVKGLFSMYHSAFTDFQTTIEDLIAEGDKVVGFLTVRGTHTGNFADTPPTGKQVAFRTMDIFRIVGDQIVEHWAMPDQFSLQQQLGLIPSPGQRGG